MCAWENTRPEGGAPLRSTYPEDRQMRHLRAKRHPSLLLPLLGLCLLGVDDCSTEPAATEPSETSDFEPEDEESGATENASVNLSELNGDCAPVAWLLCGETISADTRDPNSGSTDVLDHYDLAVGNYEGPEIAYAFQATTTESVEWSFIGAVPTEVNLDLFVFSNASGSCDVAQGMARGFNSVEFDAEAGKTYYLVVDGYDGDSGAFDAKLDCTGGAVGGPLDPPEDDAVEVSVNFSPQSYDQSHLAQTIEALDAAEDTIDFAMYSYRDGGLRQAIEPSLQLSQSGIHFSKAVATPPPG